MTRHPTSLSPEYFERMFQGTDDPWDLETSVYEQGKYNHSISALNGRRYRQALEIGCAKGMLTQRLAAQCASLLAVDVSETALAAAQARLAAHAHVAFQRLAFPQRVPSSTGFDLLVLSEVVYYWDDADIARTADWASWHIASGGDMLLVHWTGETDYPQSGDEAVRKLADALGPLVDVVTAQRCPNYRLDLWRVRP